MNRFAKISVVCPTYNSENFIINTLKTVLYQTVPPFELIVSDDGSTDNTVSKVETFFKSCTGFHTHLIKNFHKGPGATRNAGILRAKGDWVAFLDSDDLWAAHKISEVCEAIRNHREANFIFHNEYYKKLDGTKTILHDFSTIYRRDEPLILQLWRSCMIHTSTVTCKKNLLINCGLFNEKLMSAQDWELWIRMSPYIRFYHIGKILGTYIDRPSSITFTKSYNGVLDELKVMSIHRVRANVSIIEYIYRALRRLAGRIGRDINILPPSIRS